jgi:hypothetical protein
MDHHARQDRRNQGGLTEWPVPSFVPSLAFARSLVWRWRSDPTRSSGCARTRLLLWSLARCARSSVGGLGPPLATSLGPESPPKERAPSKLTPPRSLARPSLGPKERESRRPSSGPVNYSGVNTNASLACAHVLCTHFSYRRTVL